MMAMVLAATAFGAQEATVLWRDASEVSSGGLNIPQEGTYWVWAWAPGDEPATIKVNGEKMEGAKEGDPRKDYVWVKVGSKKLGPGEVKVGLGKGVAAVALSTEQAFSPASAMRDRRASTQPEPVADRRAQTAKHTDSVFSMPEFDSLEKWEPFAARLRRRILLSSGLWPLPDPCPLNARIFDRVTHDDYTVEKVHFEVSPGFLATGNLYRPVGKGPFPGVACPHGHWGAGRLANEERGSVPGRCITLARMGCVVFSYDMIGYNDSKQFEHRWGGEREKLWGIHPFGFQLLTSIRVLDFLESLPDVNSERLACTGASGGGTQTFALMAVDSRVKVAAPVNMISCSMQGGCLCENAPILRLANSNQEIGATMAPRPLLMVSATGDWTRETPRVEYPAIRSIFNLYGAPERVKNVHIQADHNYNQPSREAMYRFFGRWLLEQGDKWADFEEPPFELEPESALRVFPGDLPAGYPTADEIIRQTIAAQRAKWTSIEPKRLEDLDAFQKEYGSSLALVMGAEIPRPDDLDPERLSYEERPGYVVEGWILRRKTVGDAVPAILYRSYDATPQDVVLVVHGEGKAALAGPNGPGPLVAGLIQQGKAVMTVDAFLIGEYHSPWKRTERLRIGNFMDTFQPTDTAYRVQDVLTALSYLRSRRDLTDTIDLIGLGEGGLWCLFGGAIGNGVRRTVVDANQFNVADDQAWVDTYYMPCIRSIGDVTTAAACVAPRRLVVMNTGAAFDTSGMQRVYKAVQADGLTVAADALSNEALVDLVK